MINTTSERPKARNCFICWYFSFYEQLKSTEHEISFITSGPGPEVKIPCSVVLSILKVL